MIRLEKVAKRYDQTDVLQNVGFEVAAGELVGIIGPNGSGKSTLVKLLSGLERPDSGLVEVGGVPVHRHPRKELARWLAVLEQETLPPVGFTVREVVEMGRFPFQNWIGEERPEARHASEKRIDDIMNKLGLDELQHRLLDQLSGGEKQRVALAKAMAQQPRLLLLDEPTTYLDIGRQIQLMDRIREWQRQDGLTVVAVLHDLNLAALYCDRLLLLDSGRVAGWGEPTDILTPALIERVYGVLPITTAHPAHPGVPQLLLQPGGYRGGAG